MQLHPDTFADWSTSIIVTQNHLKVAAVLSDYVAFMDLSEISDDDFWLNVDEAGEDIRVTTNGVDEVPFELVAFDRSGRTGEAHILEPSTDPVTDDEYTFYVGNADAVAYAADAPLGSEAVWEGYAAVHHMQKNPSGSAPQMLDSTANGNHGTSAGSMVTGDSVSGKLGGGNCLEFETTKNQFISCGSDASVTILNDTSCEGWVYMTDTTISNFFMVMVGEQQDLAEASNTLYQFAAAATGDVSVNHEYNVGTNTFNTFNTNIATDEWHYVVIVRDATADTWTVFVDGAQFGSPFTYASDATGGGDSLLLLGGYDTRYGTTGMSGRLDEMRLCNTARSADNIETQFNNQNDDSTFHTWGASRFGFVADIINK